MSVVFYFVFFFNATATSEIYTLSLHDALPICCCVYVVNAYVYIVYFSNEFSRTRIPISSFLATTERSEEHTSELQSPCNLVCRLLLEKKKRQKTSNTLTMNVRLCLTR